MKVWITKYALSEGIVEVDTEVCTGDMIQTHEKWPRYFHGEGRGYHTEKQSAINHADKMRQKKIASLKKQIERLEKLRFE